MLSKKERLNKTEFDRFFRIGKRYQGQNFTLIHLPFVGTKAAVVVGKKVFKKAVLRNQLRRKVYAVLRELLKGHSGVYVILSKPGAGELDRSEIQAEISELVGRINNNS